MASAIQLPSNEYTEARREWRDRYADLAQGKRNWQCAALGFFLIAAMTSAIAIIQVRQVKRLPYVVQEDPTGAIVGENMLLAYLQAHVRSPADRYVEAYINDHNPHVVARKHSVNVIITSLVQLGPHSWQVRWIEQYLDHDGMRDQKFPDTHWIALVKTRLVSQPADDLTNPEGVVVVSWQWAPETLGQVTAQ